MRVLVACEFSGAVSAAFRAKGHEAWSCDLLPTEGDPAWHGKSEAAPSKGSRTQWRSSGVRTLQPTYRN